MSVLIERSSAPRHRIPIEATDSQHLGMATERLSDAQRRWLGTQQFTAKPGSFVLLPNADGKLDCVLVGVDASQPLQALAALPGALPSGTYQLADTSVPMDVHLAALGWALGAYQFNRYRNLRCISARLAVPASVLAAITPRIDATFMVRDLVNTPSHDMGPKQLGDVIKKLAKSHKATIREWVGDELLKAHFPTIHAVGRGSTQKPRLIELGWGKRSPPETSHRRQRCVFR